jgi:hypothetical protein
MAETKNPLAALDKLAMLGLALGFGFEALTGFGSVAVGKLMSGYLLMGHVAFGVLFAVSLTVVVLCRASAYRLDGGGCCATTCMGVRSSFWLFVLGGLCLIVTPSLAMLPLLGSPGQACVIKVHLLAAILSLCCAVVYAVLSKGGSAPETN